LLQGLLDFFLLLGHGVETAGCLFRVRAAIAFFFLVVAAIVFFFVVAFFSGGAFLDGNGGGGVVRHAAVIRVDVATEDFGQAAAFGGDAVVLGEDAVDSAGEVSDGAHDFADAFLDAFGDFDLAFAGQQFHGTHFAHVHAHRVGGAADIGFNGGEGSSGFFGCSLVGVGFGQQQGVRIRSTLEYVDPHVVDHADDVFHLFRIGNIFRQVVIDLRVSQVTLLATTADQFFQTRLLLRFYGHNTLSTE